MSSFFTELFGDGAFKRHLEIDRAHRVGQRSQQNTFPRHMLVRLHHYQTKELILKLSHELGSLEFNVRLFVFSTLASPTECCIPLDSALISKDSVKYSTLRWQQWTLSVLSLKLQRARCDGHDLNLERV